MQEAGNEFKDILHNLAGLTGRQDSATSSLQAVLSGLQSFRDTLVREVDDEARVRSLVVLRTVEQKMGALQQAMATEVSIPRGSELIHSCPMS